MYDYDELINFNVSNCPRSIVYEFDKAVKQMGFNRSSYLKLVMGCTIKNSKLQFARRAETEQFIQWGINDTIKMAGIEPTRLE